MRWWEAETPANAAMGAASTHPQSHQELLKVDGPTPVAVKMLKHSRGLFLIDGNSVIVQTLEELRQVQWATSVVIHYSEGSAKKTKQPQFEFDAVWASQHQLSESQNHWNTTEIYESPSVLSSTGPTGVKPPWWTDKSLQFCNRWSVDGPQLLKSGAKPKNSIPTDDFKYNFKCTVKGAIRILWHNKIWKTGLIRTSIPVFCSNI